VLVLMVGVILAPDGGVIQRIYSSPLIGITINTRVILEAGYPLRGWARLANLIVQDLC
jgi:hypothetical protein